MTSVTSLTNGMPCICFGYLAMSLAQRIACLLCPLMQLDARLGDAALVGVNACACAGTVGNCGQPRGTMIALGLGVDMLCK